MAPSSREKKRKPGRQLLLSDLVRDSKIETEVLGSYTQHVFHEAGGSADQRLVRREERWVRHEYLGQGAYGTVYSERREHGGAEEIRAVKEVKKFVVLGQELDYARELEAIMKFSHPKYKHCFVSSQGWYEHQDSIFITMEFLPLGDLQRYLTRPLPEYQAKQITEQVLEGLQFMHDNSSIHRDLKPANIMVVMKTPQWFVKIADFGISKRRHQDVTTMLTMQRGTLGFAAPEALGVIPDNANPFSLDMWSLGAVTYRILTNCTAFQYLHDLFKYADGNQKFPEDKLESYNVSEHGRNFIMQLMQPLPNARLSATTAAHHPWITTPIDAIVGEPSNNTLSATVQGPHENTGISTASKSWTCVSATETPSDRIRHPILDSNYQPPSVSDYSDELDIDRLPKLLVGSTSVLELADKFDNDLLLTGKATQEAEEEETMTALFIPDKTLLSGSETMPDRNDSESLACYEAQEGPKGPNGDDPEEQQGSEDDTSSEFDSSESSSHSKKDYIHNPETNMQSNWYSIIPRDRRVVKSWWRAGRACSKCGHYYPGRDDDKPIQRLPCEHYMCDFCLRQCIALSLVSPQYMPPRCCASSVGEIKPGSWDALLIDPHINVAWDKYWQLKVFDNWTCPRGHPPESGSLIVTKPTTLSPPTWRVIVHCSSCTTETGSTLQRTPYCLLCSREVTSETCEKCELNLAVLPFIKHLRENIIRPGTWFSTAISHACGDMVNEDMELQTLADLKRQLAPSPFKSNLESKSDSESTASDDAHDDIRDQLSDSFDDPTFSCHPSPNNRSFNAQPLHLQQGMDDRPGKKRSGSIPRSQASGEKPDRRRFSLPKAIGEYHSSTPPSEVDSQPELTIQTRRRDAPQGYNNYEEPRRNESHFNAAFDLNHAQEKANISPVYHQRYGAVQMENRRPTPIPSRIHLGAHVNSRSEPPVNIQRPPTKPQPQIYQAEDSESEGYVERPVSSSRGNRRELHMYHKRFTDMYAQDEYRGHEGGTAKRIMDFFRRRGKARGSEDRR